MTLLIQAIQLKITKNLKRTYKQNIIQFKDYLIVKILNSTYNFQQPIHLNLVKFTSLVSISKSGFHHLCYENISSKNTSLIGSNFIQREFDHIEIRGVNLHGAQLFNCKWKNIKIHELNKLDGHIGEINSVCFSPDVNTIETSSYDSENLPFLWLREKTSFFQQNGVPQFYHLLFLWQNFSEGLSKIKIENI
ncbi:unnamed protein product [Paramecium primaurelia]|uniref:Pentapeptide repeat-containing protein n=1 Tax=Paramecium primaurelia TaxID=5886 RepID=A0A8S1N1J1_PARPR|nr:unnamed protein product [Paramecium primaurelia]